MTDETWNFRHELDAMIAAKRKAEAERSHMIEEKAKELHASSCAARGVSPDWYRWTGRRTNRAYYRRRAKPIVDRALQNAPKPEVASEVCASGLPRDAPQYPAGKDRP